MAAVSIFGAKRIEEVVLARRCMVDVFKRKCAAETWAVANALTRSHKNHELFTQLFASGGTRQKQTRVTYLNPLEGRKVLKEHTPWLSARHMFTVAVGGIMRRARTTAE